MPDTTIGSHCSSAGGRVRIVVGNTSVGVYDDGPYSVYVDVKAIPELNVATVIVQFVYFYLTFY